MRHGKETKPSKKDLHEHWESLRLELVRGFGSASTLGGVPPLRLTDALRVLARDECETRVLSILPRSRSRTCTSPATFARAATVELQISETQHDLKYFAEIVEGLGKQLAERKVVSVTCNIVLP
jgi:hypothetical protein